MKKKVMKKTQNSEVKDLKALLAMSLAALYEMASTLNDFAPLVMKMEEVLKLDPTLSPTRELNTVEQNKEANDVTNQESP